MMGPFFLIANGAPANEGITAASPLDNFLMGATAMAFVVAGLFFLRFWRQTRDRLFFIFALSFWLLALIRLVLVQTGEETEARTFLYILRFFAFLLILIAVVDKNRSAG